MPTPFRLRERLHGAVARGFQRFLTRLAPTQVVHGVRLLSFIERSEGSVEVAFARLALALDVIGEVDPRRLAQIRRDMPTIELVKAGGGYYNPPTRTYVVDWPDLMQRTVVSQAVSIVHEAAHARMFRAGLRYPHELRERIETRCLREEIAFAQRLPDGGAYAAKLESEMERKLASRWWTDDKSIARQERQLRAHDVPRWMIRLMRWRLERASAERQR